MSELEKKDDSNKNGNILFEFHVAEIPDHWEQAVSLAGLTCEETAERIVQRFNEEEVDRYGKEAVLRHVTGVRILSEGFKTKDKVPHQWRKKSNATVLSNGKQFDRMECIVCGAQGRRHGLDSFVKTSRKYCRK